MVPLLAPHIQNSWGFYCRLNYSNLVPLLAPRVHLFCAFTGPSFTVMWCLYLHLVYIYVVPLLAPHLQLLAPCLHLCATSYSVSAMELTVLMLPFAHWFLYGFFSGIYSDDIKHLLLKLSCADMWYFNEFQVANGT